MRRATYASFFFLVWTDRRFAKDTHACCFNNYTTTIVFYFFSGRHNRQPKPKLEASKTCMIGMYAFMLSSLLISRKAVEISHTHVENCMHARAGLDFVSCHEPTKRSQPGGWQPPPPQKVATSIYCIIIQPFSSHLSSRI